MTVESQIGNKLVPLVMPLVQFNLMQVMVGIGIYTDDIEASVTNFQISKSDSNRKPVFYTLLIKYEMVSKMSYHASLHINDLDD